MDEAPEESNGLARKEHIMSGKTTLNSLEPAQTALLVVHMVKELAGEVATAFSRLFRHRFEETEGNECPRRR